MPMLLISPAESPSASTSGGSAKEARASKAARSTQKRATASVAKKWDAATHGEIEAQSLRLDPYRTARACFVNHVVPEDPPDNADLDQLALDTVLSALEVRDVGDDAAPPDRGPRDDGDFSP